MTSIPAHLDPRFEGKHIIITGAGGNFGREGCIYFADRRAKITALDLNMTTLTETESLVKDKVPGAQISCYECNVTDPASVQSAIDQAVEKFGTPDACWNNAGYQGEIKPTLEYSITDFSNVMSINVIGMFTVLQTVAKKMAAANADEQSSDTASSHKYSIVNTASVAAMRGTPAMVAYSASKAAILAMTVSSAKDLAPMGIRVNAISPALIGPGFMWDRQNELHAKSGSPYFATDPEVVAKSKVNSVPMKRLGSIEEVVKSVAYLLSDDSSYTTAFNLVVDGGMSGGLR
jgi:NAD(P)-dependent dehydrogenase (short-subunit alcohol dehydrogenase family)